MKRYRVQISNEYFIHNKVFGPVLNLNTISAYLYNSNNNAECNKVLIFDGPFEDRFDHKIIKNKKCWFVVDYSYENGLSQSDVDNKVKRYKKLGINPNDVLMILNSSAQSYPVKAEFKIIYIDIFAISAVARVFDYKHPVSRFSNRPKKFNLLLGKIGKLNRAEAIYRFYKKGILENTVAGLLGERKEIHSALDLKDPVFYRDIRHYLKSPDKVKTAQLSSGTTSQGWSNKSIVYDNSSVSYICETFDNTEYGNFITEKTYRPIINQHPFVVQASPRMLEYMREQGFKTFNNLINESYDKDPVSVNRIDNTIDQAVKLLDHTLTNADTVKSIVTHNYNMLLDRARHQLNELKQHLDLLLT